MNGTIHRINDRGYNEYTTYANLTERTFSPSDLYEIVNFITPNISKI